MKTPMVEVYSEDKKLIFNLTNSTNLTNLEETVYIVYQDKKYLYIILKNVEDIADIEDIELLVNNEIVEIEWSKKDNQYILIIQRSSPLFLLTYGLTEIVIRVKCLSGEERVFFSPPLSVAINKRYVDNIDSLFEMLDVIYQKNSLLLFQNKIENRRISTTRNNSKNKIEEELELLTAIVQSLNKEYLYFINNAHVLTETQYSVDSIEKLKNIGPKNIQYISMHPEELQKSYNHKGINILNQRFIPDKTLVSISRYTKNTYENKMVMAFIWTLYVHVCNRQEELQKFLLKDKIDIMMDQEIGDDYVLCTKIINQHIKLLYEAYQKNYQKLKNILLEIYNKYSKALLDYPVILNKIPEPTSIFLEIYHYRNVFHLLNLWFGREKENIPHRNMILQFSNADRIYEYYCLLGIHEILNELGYEEILEKRELYNYKVRYSKFSNTENANTFYFVKDKTKITLYYQPVIYSEDSQTQNNIGLFRVDANFYTPDFIIKKEKANEKDTSYIILDAKWRNRNTLLKKENEGGLRDLVYKYLYSVVDSSSMQCVENLWLLQGKDDSAHSDFYIHRRGEISKKKSDKFRMQSGIVRFTPKTGNAGLKRVINSFVDER